MGRACTICGNHAHALIDAALETDRSLRDIATQFGVSKTALHRHWRTHMLGGSPSAPNTGTGMKVGRRSSRVKTIAKWVLITGLGLGVLVWMARGRMS